VPEKYTAAVKGEDLARGVIFNSVWKTLEMDLENE